MKNMGEIYGVTPLSDVPGKNVNLPIFEICETDEICIPKDKPSIEEILEIFLKITTYSIKVISTTIGKKLIINGTKHIKLIYMSSRSSRNIHSLVFEIPFCTSRLLEHHGEVKISEIKTSVEFITVRNPEARCFSISSVFTMYPVYHKQTDHNNNIKHKEDKHSDHEGSDDRQVSLSTNENLNKYNKNKSFSNLCSDNTSKCEKCKKTNCKKRNTKNKYAKGFEECSAYSPANDDWFIDDSYNNLKQDIEGYSDDD